MKRIFSVFVLMLLIVLCGCEGASSIDFITEYFSSDKSSSEQAYLEETVYISGEKHYFELNFDVLSFNTGETACLSVYTDIDSEPVIWKSSDPAVASVNSTGNVIAVSKGNAEIYAVCEKLTAVCKVTVSEITADVTPDPVYTYRAYYIKINKLTNCVTVYYANDDGDYIPVKSMVCSSGITTPRGTFTIGTKRVWNRLFGNVWGMYVTQINGDILFHSVPYMTNSPDSLITEDYNLLGTTASAGCIRLCVSDAKWIYDWCAPGTVVEIYSGGDTSPLGKPETIDLPAGCTWDPTDPTEGNPYCSLLPSISGAASRVLTVGSDTDVLEDIYGADIFGGDITDRIIVNGKADINTAGIYTINLSLTDTLGRSVSDTFTVTVLKIFPEILSAESDKISVSAGNSIIADVVFDPVNTTETKLEWYSLSPDIINVSSDGLITGNKPGNGRICCRTINDLYLYFTVTVTSD